MQYAVFRIFFYDERNKPMEPSILSMIGQQLISARKEKGLNQGDVADRLGRDRARISELDRDLANNRLGRDRLTLFAEMCEALDLVPLLIPKSRLNELRPLISEIPEQRPTAYAPSAFDDLFIDLNEEEG